MKKVLLTMVIFLSALSLCFMNAPRASAQCTDNDGDGFSIEGGACGAIDCNDGSTAIYPGAPEICDHLDNQCRGDLGFGLIDEGCAFEQFQPPYGATVPEAPTMEWTAANFNAFRVSMMLPMRGIYWYIDLPWVPFTYMDMKWLPNYSFIWCNLTPGRPILWWVFGVNTRTFHFQQLGPSIFFKGTCTPNCVERECGDDGCGGSCGECPPQYTCQPDGQCVD